MHDFDWFKVLFAIIAIVAVGVFIYSIDLAGRCDGVVQENYFGFPQCVAGGEVK